MNLTSAVQAAAFVLLLFGTASVFAQPEVAESSCNATTYFSVRSAWASENEPCHQKLSLDMWAFMKAEGSAKDPDAHHAYVYCMRSTEIGLMELIIPEDWSPDLVSAGIGEIVAESDHAVSFLCKAAEDFEAICNDEAIVKATRVTPLIGVPGPDVRTRRRLKDTTSEAGRAHQVEELIEGLEDLGCENTKGESQTLCVMSDSFNNNNQAASLQTSGDLPMLAFLKDYPTPAEKTLSDEGSAMIELAFDIASGASYKFNTAYLGDETFATDIGALAGEQNCDVIVDDIFYPNEPSFRDGAIARAVDKATSDHNVLYFSSAGNYGHGHRFSSGFQCQQLLMVGVTNSPCALGISTHLFNPLHPDEKFRYLFQFTSKDESRAIINWDFNEGGAPELTIAIWHLELDEPVLWSMGTSDPGVASAVVTTPGGNKECFISIHQTGGPFLQTSKSMHLVSLGNDFGGTIANSGSMLGHACARSAISVAAMDHDYATGANKAFADPETALVEEFSSRGTCHVSNNNNVVVERNHPVTTAANGLQTSTTNRNKDFRHFFGTSAAAPVAAAIATIIRGACAPAKVVTYADMMEMLTNYDYTIDVISDAGMAPKTFGPEAGYGIISADKLCLWVAENCPETCPNTDADAGAHGDPHLVGLAGQKFDFTGHSNSWYSILSAWGTEHVNMRVTAPLPNMPRVTYITGISVQTEDEDGVGHSIVIFVSDPSELDTKCPTDGQPCFGDGALTVVVDGESVVSPGETEVGPGVSVVAANIPGECRPFGFERYWQQKVRETEFLAAHSNRRLSELPTMDKWITEDVSATNPAECEEYVARAVESETLFTHQSDHVLFQISTPRVTLRLNHGQLHQIAERDPTDTFDIPDHTTFQMNLGLMNIKRDETMQGIIGETSVPTTDENGDRIMSGLKAIRGQEDDYKVDGVLGKTFKQLSKAV